MEWPRPKKGSPIVGEERERIIAALQEHSIHAVAKMSGRSKNAVYNVAKAEGIDSDTKATAAASRARSEYSSARRIELINKFFDKIDDLVDDLPDDPVAAARAMRDLATSLGITIDKRRLEDGDATERTETVTIIDDIPEIPDEPKE